MSTDHLENSGKTALSSVRPGIIWRIMRRLNSLLSIIFRSERKFGPPVLILVTSGRKSGRAHRTPLQFELIDDCYYVASARGTHSDWFRNIIANADVQFELEGRQYQARAEAITDPELIADFLELRLERQPRMVKGLLRLEGLPKSFSRADLVEFSRQKAIVILHPGPGEIGWSRAN